MSLLTTRYPSSLLADLAQTLRRHISGDVRIDLATRLLYSTDASIYQIEPIGVVIPKSLDDLTASVEIAREFKVPVLARGSGSSLAGQAIGEALILDCSRYLNRIIDINIEENSATVEPGVILSTLNHLASNHRLKFGPDPASADRATVGGSLANNATGAHSIRYGMAADHLLAAEVLLADGSTCLFEPVSLEEARRRGGIIKAAEGQGGFTEVSSNRTVSNTPIHSRESAIYSAVLQIRERYSEVIKRKWPKTWRRVSGYNLNYLIPWSPSQPPQWQGDHHPYPPVSPGTINLAAILAGSEGTLAIIRKATIRLVPTPHHAMLAILAYDSLYDACAAIPDLLRHEPSAIELIPKNLLRLARSVPAYAYKLSFINQTGLARDTVSHASKTMGGPHTDDLPAALLVLEFSGDDIPTISSKIQKLSAHAVVIETDEGQKDVWSVRKVGLGLLMSQPGDIKPVPFIEDLSVPVESLGVFVREMDRILQAHGTSGDFYAHASAGCLHIRPLINIKSVEGLSAMRAIAEEAVSLVLSLDGAVSGEHGDGIARSEWLERSYGTEIMNAFRLLKSAADPEGLLNPGKIIDPPRMDSSLRYSPHDADLRSNKPIEWIPTLDFSRQAGFQSAIELCNGAGVCRKPDGLMCPSFQATGEEMHSTRGRANLLRSLIYGNFPDAKHGMDIIYEALDLCLACKGCKSECPSAVDMAKLKYEFLNAYYNPTNENHNRRPLRDYLFSHIGTLSRIAHPFTLWINFAAGWRIAGWLGDNLLGISTYREPPALNPKTLTQLYREHIRFSGKGNCASNINSMGDCLFLSDPFTEYFYPEVGMAAIQVLEKVGARVRLIPTIGAGRTYLSKGFLEKARDQALRVVNVIATLDPDNKASIIGVEPSEIYTLRDEYPDLLPKNETVTGLENRSFMIDEFLVRPGENGLARIHKLVPKDGEVDHTRPAVFLHGHCYQKAQPPADDGYPTGVEATKKMLDALGYRVSIIQSGCCGMAGAFGYEKEHYQLSMKIGELELFPAIRDIRDKEPEAIIATAGISCQAQIKDGTGVTAPHPIHLAIQV